MGLTTSREDCAPLGGAAEVYQAYGRATARAAAVSPAALKRARDSPPHTPEPDPEKGVKHPLPAQEEESSPEENYVIPSVFTWNFGGQQVYVTGAWDGWREKTPMYKNGAEYTAVIYVPCGEYQFKYFVDENWRCNPSLATQTDEHGNTNNVVKVVPVESDFDSSQPVGQGDPPSPLSSYDQSTMDDFPADVPLLPPQLAAYTTGGTRSLGEEELGGTSHVRVDHLFTNRTEDNLRYLSATSRYGTKMISTVFVTNAEQEGPASRSQSSSHHRLPLVR